MTAATTNSSSRLETAYSLRPSYKEKPTTSKMKTIIKKVIQDQLQDQTYTSETASQWTKTIGDEIKLSLKSLEFPRYKYLVQVVVGEQRGEGVRMGTRCLWDAETDSYASECYSNDSLFCVATAYAVYLY